MTAENKVQFNLKNVHYAVVTETVTSQGITETFGSTVAVPGAVNLSLAAAGQLNNFYADGVKYYTTSANSGYSGSLEIARIPDQMLQDVFDFTLDSSGVMIEDVDCNPKSFALLFQIDGDQASQLYCMYKCKATRPNIAGQTTTESNEPNTATIDIEAAPLSSNGRVVARTSHTTSTSVVTGWFDAVYTA